MLTSTEQAQQEKIQVLLARKRLEIPGEDYFSSVLPQFHRRQREALLKPRSRFSMWLEDLYENFVAPVSPSIRYATATVVVALGLGVGLMHSWNDGSNSSSSYTLKLQQTQASHNAYAFSQAIDDITPSTKIDQQLDAAVIGKTASATGELPHYVLASGPTGYDSNLAF